MKQNIFFLILLTFFLFSTVGNVPAYSSEVSTGNESFNNDISFFAGTAQEAVQKAPVIVIATKVPSIGAEPASDNPSSYTFKVTKILKGKTAKNIKVVHSSSIGTLHTKTEQKYLLFLLSNKSQRTDHIYFIMTHGLTDLLAFPIDDCGKISGIKPRLLGWQNLSLDTIKKWLQEEN